VAADTSDARPEALDSSFSGRRFDRADPVDQGQHRHVRIRGCSCVPLLGRVGDFQSAEIAAQPLTGQAAAPSEASAVPRLSVSRLEKGLRVLQLAGLLAAFGMFHLFIRAHLLSLYFVYLSLPLCLVLYWTGRHVIREWRQARVTAPRLAVGSVYAVCTLATWAVLLLAFFGTHAWSAYIVEQIRVLSRLDIESPLPALGAHGQYPGFNRYYWPLLPWFVTAIVLDWLLISPQQQNLSRAEPFEIADARMAGLFTVVTLHSFVIYARGDESHLIQAVLPAAVIVFAMLPTVEVIEVSLPAKRARMRAITIGVTLIAVSTLVSLPSVSDFQLDRGDWSNPRLRYLRYHTPSDDRASELPVGMEYRQWDAYIDGASREVNALTRDGEEVLVLGGTQLLNYASNTLPAGGKYSHLFYMLRSGLLDRDSFLELMPEEVYARLLSDPPRVIVTQDGDDTVLEALPELSQTFRSSGYDFECRWGPFVIYTRAVQPLKEKARVGSSAAR
jgi:hypothetical protein